MKICYISARRYTVSPEIQEYPHNLAALNVECDLVYRREENESLLDLGERINNLAVVSAPILGFSITSILQFVSATRNVIGRNQYDVVHVNSFRGCSLLPILGRKISRNWLVDIRSSNVKSKGLKSKLADRLTALESRAFSGIMIHSEELGRAMLGNRPYAVVPPGADIARFRTGQRELTRQQLNLAPDEMAIIYSGTMIAQRNPFQVLETFAKVAASHTKSKLLMVGDSDLLAQLRRWAEVHNLAHRIIFTGRVPYDHVQNYVAAADIGFSYVPVTPNFEYNPPLKTVEFLAGGLPTVATNTAGSRMYVQHEFNGLLAEDDPQALAQAIQRLLDNNDLQQYLRSNAAQSVLAYDWRTIVEHRLLPLYEQTVGSN